MSNIKIEKQLSTIQNVRRKLIDLNEFAFTGIYHPLTLKRVMKEQERLENAIDLLEQAQDELKAYITNE